MSGLWSSIKGLSFLHAIVGAVVLLLAAMLVFKSGLVNSLLWLGALFLLIVGVVNYISYSGNKSGV